MKFTVTFKHPDAAYYAIKKAVDSERTDRNIDDSEAQEIAEDINDFAAKWIICGEYIHIEFDTDAGASNRAGE